MKGGLGYLKVLLIGICFALVVDATPQSFPILSEVHIVTKFVKQTTTMVATQAVLLGVLPGFALAATFSLEKATVADINAVFDAGALTSEQLTQLYLNRIDAYDNNGPNINSFLTINPKLHAIS